MDQAKRQMEAPEQRNENIDAMNERLTKWQDSLRAGRLPPKPVVDLEPASLSIEQRKVYLERELGLSDFLKAYWYLNESSRPQDETVDKKRGSLESMVSAKAI